MLLERSDCIKHVYAVHKDEYNTDSMLSHITVSYPYSGLSLACHWTLDSTIR